MWIKITNCSISNSSGKTRKNQNVQINVRDDLFDDISKEDFIMKYSQGYTKYGYGKHFRTTTSSKVIIPEESMTTEQRLLFERKAKTKTLLNNIEKQKKADGESY